MIISQQTVFYRDPLPYRTKIQRAYVSKIMTVEKFCPSKILSVEFLSDKVLVYVYTWSPKCI